MPVHSERVKVVVRLRPPFPHETGGAVVVNKDQSSISVFREYGLRLFLQCLSLAESHCCPFECAFQISCIASCTSLHHAKQHVLHVQAVIDSAE